MRQTRNSTPDTAAAAAPAGIDLRQVFRTWSPLAASWILMAMELPAVTAVMARLQQPRISLAAYGGIVFPMSMIIEAPIIMLLSASTALSKDARSFALLRRFMFRIGAALTAIHLLLALTPLYDFVMGRLIHAPEEILAPARIGLIIMTPWTFSIAYRRLHQGVMIRFGHSHLVGIGTAIRLAANGLVLAAGIASGRFPGIVVGAAGVACGVVSEAVFIGIVSRPVLHGPLRNAPEITPALTFRSFLHFYVPLAMTSLLLLLSAPIGSAGVSRMPRPLDSLAVWPVLNGLVFFFRSLGIALNEVIVAMLDRPGARPALRRFALILGTATATAILIIAATPLAGIYFARVSALSPPLADLARHAVWLVLPLPALAVLQSWFQGNIMHGRRTRSITEAVVVFLIVNGVALVAGILQGRTTGLYVALAANVIGALAQVTWLRHRHRAPATV
jgi:hypothetical protein